jgi:hypothetical protein
VEDAGVVHGVRVQNMPVLHTGESAEDAGVVHGVRVWRMLVLYTD